MEKKTVIIIAVVSAVLGSFLGSYSLDYQYWIDNLKTIIAAIISTIIGVAYIGFQLYQNEKSREAQADRHEEMRRDQADRHENNRQAEIAHQNKKRDQEIQDQKKVVDELKRSIAACLLAEIDQITHRVFNIHHHMTNNTSYDFHMQFQTTMFDTYKDKIGLFDSEAAHTIVFFYQIKFEFDTALEALQKHVNDTPYKTLSNKQKRIIQGMIIACSSCLAWGDASIEYLAEIAGVDAKYMLERTLTEMIHTD